MSERFDTAQICLNGHVATAYFETSAEFRQKYCDRCGAETITQCPSCKKPIRGGYRSRGWAPVPYQVPSFCIECGHSFPWTEAKIVAAMELAQELGSLDKDDQAILKQSIDDMVQDKPTTQVAVVRFKKIMKKVGQEGATMFREILVDVVSETAKKLLWPVP